MNWELQRIRLDRGGYAPSGQYFGIGAPVYEAHCPGWKDGFWATAMLVSSSGLGCNSSDLSRFGCCTFRASDREAAKEKIRKLDKKARFPRGGIQ